ncbi:MAG: alpha/beta fold hydrolase [Actinomycetota bacterium]|nr:alpha/beta hydrolase [Actinomycetota bacterium]
MPIVRSGDADINYNTSGQGIPVLLIMGLAADSAMWIMQVPALEAAGYQVITLDNRGVGASSSPPGPYTMETMAADALAVLDVLGIEKAHVVGVSMGGAIAQELALKAPERIRSLTLVSTWAETNEYTRRLDDLGRLILDNLGREALIRASMFWLFTPKLFIENPAMVDMIEQMAVAMQGNEAAFINQTAAVREHHLIDRLHEIAAPTLIVVGRRDILVPPELSERIAERIPNSVLTILDGGHAFTFEHADQFNAELVGWLASN